MFEALSIDDFAAQLSQADQPEQPEGDSGPEDQDVSESEGQTPEGEEPEVEAQAEDEGDEQDEQPEEPESSDDRVVKWTTASGEAFEVTEKELQAGYMRTSDYTQKAQAVAEERRQIQQAVQSQLQEVEQLAEERGHLGLVRHELQQYQNVNWKALAQEDPASYQHHRLRLLELQGKEQSLISDITVKRQKFATQAQEQQRSNMAEANAKAMQLLSQHIKGFDSDAGIRQKAITRMSTAGREYGFSADELSAVVDGRMLRVLNDAAQWQALQAQKPKAVKKVATVPSKAPAVNRTAPTRTEQLVKGVLAKSNVKTNDFAAALAASRKR
jgi:uncharacterized protein YaiE (UPF0345 family)